LPASCIVYVEGGQSLLRSLKQVLEPAYEVVAMVDNALSLVDAISALSPALVVVDACGLSSEQSLLRHLHHRFPEPALVLLLEDMDPVAVRAAESWGAQGVVDRGRAAEDLVRICDQILAKRRPPRGRSSEHRSVIARQERTKTPAVNPQRDSQNQPTAE
jgi:DNA-binding NarL/FixJ family response regulator